MQSFSVALFCYCFKSGPPVWKVGLGSSVIVSGNTLADMPRAVFPRDYISQVDSQEELSKLETWLSC